MILVVDMQSMTIQYQQMGFSRTPSLGNRVVYIDKPVVAEFTPITALAALTLHSNQDTPGRKDQGAFFTNPGVDHRQPVTSCGASAPTPDEHTTPPDAVTSPPSTIWLPRGQLDHAHPTFQTHPSMLFQAKHGVASFGRH